MCPLKKQAADRVYVHIIHNCMCFNRGDISENVDQNQKEVFEEMGVQTDEDLEVNHEAFSKLQMKRRRI